MHKLFQKNNNSDKGFTILELLVIVFISTMITGFAVANFRSAEKRKAVRLASDTVINVLRTAQNYSLSGRQIPVTATRVFNSAAVTDCPSGTKVPSDYRVTFSGSTNTYNIYATDKCYDIWRIETGRLPGSTQVRANGILVDVSNLNAVQFQFSPPFAKVTVGNTVSLNPSPTFNTFRASEITVEHTDGSVSEVVRLDAISGKIGER